MHVTSRKIESDFFEDGKPTGHLRETEEGRAYLRAHYRKAVWHRPSKFDRGKFICWDGEGVSNEDGSHSYVLFANSLGSSIQTKRAGDTLSTSRCLNFLLRIATANPGAIHVIFSGSYDFNMMLKSLEYWQLKQLLRDHSTRYRHYRIRVIMGKWFFVKNLKTDKSVKLWDVFSFFQTSFVKTLKAWDIDTGANENIASQKARRSVFQFSELPEVKAYCFQELEALSRLMTDFRDALAEANLELNRWDGPGAIAAKLFTVNQIKDHKQTPPEEVNRAAQYAYAGGRIEMVRQGNYEGDVYYYDINSAYPAHIAELPSLQSVRWRERGSVVRPFSICKIRWNFNPAALHPFHWRSPTGNIHFPHSGANWLWGIEYLSLPASLKNCCQVLAAYTPTDNGERPFQWVRDLYEQRRQWKEEGRGSEKVLKLGLNSLYGKMIQQVGYSKDRGIPPYHQLEWGGYVTASTRAQIYAAAMSNPSAVVGIETDGVITTQPLKVRIGEGIGAWSVSQYTGVTYVQSGVYWLRDGNGDWFPKYRGFDTGSLKRADVLSAYAGGKPTVRASLTRFQGLSYSLQFPNRFRSWCTWSTQEKELNVFSGGSKRAPLCGGRSRSDCRGCREGLTHAMGLHDTTQHADVGYLMSTPYPLVWKEGKPEWREQWLAELELDYHSPLYDQE